MSSVFGGVRPDITPAQIVGTLVAGVPIVANLLRAFGVYDVTPEQQQALQDAMTWGGVLAGLLFVSDAGIRAARNIAWAKRDDVAALYRRLEESPSPGARAATAEGKPHGAEDFVNGAGPHPAGDR